MDHPDAHKDDNDRKNHHDDLITTKLSGPLRGHPRGSSKKLRFRHLLKIAVRRRPIMLFWIIFWSIHVKNPFHLSCHSDPASAGEVHAVEDSSLCFRVTAQV